MLGLPCVSLGVPGNPWITKIVLQGTKMVPKWFPNPQKWCPNLASPASPASSASSASPAIPAIPTSHQSLVGPAAVGEALRSAALCNFIAQLRRRVGYSRSKALGTLFRFMYTFVSTTLF